MFHLLFIVCNLKQTIFRHPLSSLLGIVSENDVSSCSLEACKRLQNNLLLIKPASFASSLDHGVFSRNVISSDWEIRVVLQATNHIKIRHTRLDHEHICSLGRIKCSFNECFSSICRILLIRLLVSKSRVAIKSITERSIVCRSIFCGVCKN